MRLAVRGLRLEARTNGVYGGCRSGVRHAVQ